MRRGLFGLVALGACVHAPPPVETNETRFDRLAKAAIAHHEGAGARPRLDLLAAKEAMLAIEIAERDPTCVGTSYCPPGISMTPAQRDRIEALRLIAKARPAVSVRFTWSLSGPPECAALIQAFEPERARLAALPTSEAPVEAALVLERCSFTVEPSPPVDEQCPEQIGVREISSCACDPPPKVACECPAPAMMPVYENRPCRSWTVNGSVSLEGSATVGAITRRFAHRWAVSARRHRTLDGRDLPDLATQAAEPTLEGLILTTSGKEPNWGPAYENGKPLARTAKLLSILGATEGDELRLACLSGPLQRQLPTLEVPGLEAEASQRCRDLW